MMINAQDILLQNQRIPPDSSLLDIKIWNVKNEALHARIWKSLTVETRHLLPPTTNKTSADLWESILIRFGLTKAQERYNLLHDMCTLKLEGSDYINHQSKWLQIKADFQSLQISVDDILHDLFLQSLGTWQSAFVKTKLDEFFTTGGSGTPIRNLDIDDLMRQLQYRAQMASKKPAKESAKSFNAKDSSSSNSNAASDNSRPRMTRCAYCQVQNGYHTEADCYCKHPEKAPKDWLASRASFVRSIRQKHGDPIDLPILDPTPAKAAISSCPATSNLGDWYFDTCAGFHMTPNKALFTSYNTIPAAQEVAESIYGQTSGVLGIGDIRLHQDGLTVNLSNVRHIPGLNCNLLSMARLHDDGFKIHLSEKPPYYYEVVSPQGQSLYAVRSPQNVYKLATKLPSTILTNIDSNAISLPAFKASCKTNSDAQIVPKTSVDIKSSFPKSLWEWHVALGHLNYRDVLYLATKPDSGV